MRILLSEGSGLTSRQVAGRLGSLGHEVEILSSSRICLTRFTRYVRAVHDVPRFGLDPFGWLAAAERIAGECKTDDRAIGAPKIPSRRDDCPAFREPRAGGA